MADRVKCDSRRSIENLLASIEESISKTLQVNDDIDNNEKERIIARFKEVYFDSIKSNVIIDDLRWEEASKDETAEFKPLDLEKRKYVQTTLVELVDNSIVRVCGRRKKYPPRLTFNCRKNLEAKAVQCVKRKVQLPDIKVCPHAVTELIKPLRTEKLVESCQDLTSQVKTVPDVLLKTDRLKKSTETCKNHKMALSNSVLFNDSVVIPHEEDSIQSKLLIQL